MIVRPAVGADVAAVRALIDGFAAEGRMLERTEAFLRANLADFQVAVDGDHLLGCGALAVLTADLAELRSLAVAPEAAQRGVGRAIVAACIDRARERGLRRVFALTLVPVFFTKCGFTLTSLGRLPEKSTAECPVCPKRFACDEHAMLLNLDGSIPPALDPTEPVGYTRLFLHTEPS